MGMRRRSFHVLKLLVVAICLGGWTRLNGLVWAEEMGGSGRPCLVGRWYQRVQLICGDSGRTFDKYRAHVLCFRRSIDQILVGFVLGQVAKGVIVRQKVCFVSRLYGVPKWLGPGSFGFACFLWGQEITDWQLYGVSALQRQCSMVFLSWSDSFLLWCCFWFI